MMFVADLSHDVLWLKISENMLIESVLIIFCLFVCYIHLHPSKSVVINDNTIKFVKYPF